MSSASEARSLAAPRWRVSIGRMATCASSPLPCRSAATRGPRRVSLSRFWILARKYCAIATGEPNCALMNQVAAAMPRLAMTPPFAFSLAALRDGGTALVPAAHAAGDEKAERRGARPAPTAR